MHLRAKKSWILHDMSPLRLFRESVCSRGVLRKCSPVTHDVGHIKLLIHPMTVCWAGLFGHAYS